MPNDGPIPVKLDVALALLEEGSVFVYLDPRHEGVVVPPHLRQRPQLVLQIGLDLPVPIRDLEVDDDGVFATLSFDRTPFSCTIPWGAVHGLAGDDAMAFLWRDDLPDELRAPTERAAEVAKAGPSLRAIDGRRGDRPPDDEPGAPRHLRLVK